MEILIQTGELKVIKTGFASRSHIVYSGMPNETSFAITFFVGHHSSNIFYPKDSAFITILDRRFKVIEATPEYIILKFEKNMEALQKDPTIRLSDNV